MSGCSAGSRYAPLPYDRPAVPPPTVVTTSNEGVRSAASAELGPEVAASIPATQHALPQAPDPGAVALVNSMLAGLGERATGADGITHVGLEQVRNQSHAGPGEYQKFMSRFAGVLNEAGKEWRIAFTAEPGAMVEYQMQGTAYTAVVQGIDAWELYLSMSLASRPYAVWQAKSAVHVIRQAREGVPQILP